MKTEFEKKIAQFERKLNTCWNTKPKHSLTESWWFSHGNKLQTLIDECSQYSEWSDYCKSQGWVTDFTVGDCMS